MRLAITTILLAGALTVWLPGAGAQTPCPPYRPCGMGNTWGGNRLVKQGFFGADFRPACQGHDTCEGPSRDCDRRFLYDMYAACDSSTNPRKCRQKARQYYLASRIYHTLKAPVQWLSRPQ